MVGYDGSESRSSKLTHADVAFAGAASGLATRALCQPLDVLKIRFQLQVEPISAAPASRYRSLGQAVRRICREEGARALWKGHVPAQWLSVTYGLGQFWCFEAASRLLYEAGARRRRPAADFVCGAAAGAFATFLSFPFDVARTRLVAQAEGRRLYRGTVHALACVWRREGPAKLYRGVLPTLLQVAPQAGVQFCVYRVLVLALGGPGPGPGSGWRALSDGALCGSLAGLCAKLAVYPLDLAKKRLQVQGADRAALGQHFRCAGLLDCLRRTAAREGARGLYKGLLPSLLKAALASALHFGCYELLCRWLSALR